MRIKFKRKGKSIGLSFSRRAMPSRKIKKGTRTYDVASGIAKNLINNPLEDGEQMNIVAFIMRRL